MEHPEKLTREQCLDLAKLVEEAGGIAGALLFANSLTDKALEEIEKLPAGRSRDILSEATQLLLQRKY